MFFCFFAFLNGVFIKVAYITKSTLLRICNRCNFATFAFTSLLFTQYIAIYLLNAFFYFAFFVYPLFILRIISNYNKSETLAVLPRRLAFTSLFYTFFWRRISRFLSTIENYYAASNKLFTSSMYIEIFFTSIISLNILINLS